MSADAWLRRFHAADRGGLRLVCFPHAGGAASFFRPLSGLLTPRVETLAVQYPGRQDLRLQPPAASIEELADRLAVALGAPGPLALFGHSMGAVVAYEVARRLGGRVGTLYASGHRAPSVPCRPRRRDDAALLAELAWLGGTDARLFEDPQMRRIILDPLRSDYAALNAYRDVGGAPLGCRIVALVGDSDPVTSVGDAKLWERHTDGAFTVREFSGGHFYLTDHWAGVAAVIAETLG